MSNYVPIDVIRERLKKIHADSFEYPKLDDEYFGMSSVISVICPIHNLIKKTMSSLIHNKSGCPHCASLRRIISRGSNKEKARSEMNRFYDFIRKQNMANQTNIIKPNYSLIARQYLRLRLDDGHGDYLSKPEVIR